MRPIDRKTLIDSAKSGRADINAVMKALGKPAEAVCDIDDRDPMDRVADELVRFTAAIQEMNQTQAAEAASVLRQILMAIKAMKEHSAVAPAITMPPPERPTEWKCEVTARDKNGHIAAIKLKAEKEKRTLQ